MTYKKAIVKRNTEYIFMLPFVWLGKMAGMLFPLKSQHHVFLFFPSATIGGSIKVNADITNCIRSSKPLVIFSKRSSNSQFRHLFDIEGVRIIDLSKYIDYKIFHFVNFFFRGVLAAWINKAAHPVVFGGESLFFYKILPHVKKNTRTVELCHLNTWFDFSQAYIEYIDYRVFSTPKIRRDVEDQYRHNHIDKLYNKRLLFIDNKIDIPQFKQVQNEVLQVIYVGRGAPQKRVYLITEIARRMHETNKPVHFSFVGDVEEIVPASVKAYCTLYGNLRDENRLHELYAQSDVLILTSAYEGLPLVVMDMMARGKVVLSTAVDGIPDYITTMQNGLLITETDEEKIVQQGVELLDMLIKNPGLRNAIGQKSYRYALEHFNGADFCRFYSDLIVGRGIKI
jgi:L-malate glycosyltransferase